MRTSFAAERRLFLALGLGLLIAVPSLAQQAPAGALVDAIAAAAVPPTTGGRALLPLGTQLDRYEWIDNLARIDLTLPADTASDAFSAGTVEAIYSTFVAAIDPTRSGGGLNVRARFGAAGEYIPLESLVPAPASPPEKEVREAAPTKAIRTLAKTSAQFSDAQNPPAPTSIGGPVGTAGTQPVGALTGVTVFTTAGHGWTAEAVNNTWFLQRELLLDMNEDYANLDQLNYFVQYLFNAGATVVPFRPVGYQSLEFVLDNDDPGVTWTGTWNDNTDSPEYYENGTTVSGVRYRWATAAATESAVARYTPNLTKTDYYPVYCWTRDGDDRVRQTYRIVHNGGTSSVVVDHRLVGKGWVWLGNYHMLAGTGNYVEITNASPDSGVVVADAIRFGNGIGDMVGIGPNTVSGFPREEECMRYWAQSEAGVRAFGLPPTIWDQPDRDDSGDNVGTGARWGAAMNRQSVNNDRWRRVYLEFHSNAAGCSSGPPCDAKGECCLITTSGATTNQIQYATLLGNKVGNDMFSLSSQFEYPWVKRSPTYTSAYGAISTPNNNDEFDATIIEVAFHDNIEDTANLLNPKVRNALARSSLQGIIQFLNGLPGSTVPLAFPPEAPENVRAINNGSGGVVVSWTAPPSGVPNGDPATGYRIYRSTDGYGYDGGTPVGNVLTYTITDIPPRTTTYIRIAATNAGGESMPSETLAVRLPAPGAGNTRVLLVYGFNRVDKTGDTLQNVPQGSFHRAIISKVNTFNYVIQHAASLTTAGVSFDSSSNEAVAAGSVSLSGYGAVDWILGRNSTADKTLSTAEQAALNTYLAAGGRLFISGMDIAYDLDYSNNGRDFFQNTLRCAYSRGSSNAFLAQGVTGGIFSDVASFNFGNPSGGAPYQVESPDVFTARTGAVTAIKYVTFGTVVAGVQYDSGTYKTVTLAIPFESIHLSSVRDAIMQRVLDYFGVAEPEPCHVTMIGDFEAYADATTGVIFRNPRFSTTTSANLAATPDTAKVTTEVAPYDGAKSYKLEWAFADTTPQRWLRLTTDGAANLPSPTIRIDRPLRMRLRLEGPTGSSLLLSLGVRETNTNAQLGANGGTTGTVEWVGATTVISGAPQGMLVTADPGVWQTIVFYPVTMPIAPLTGDGYLTGLHNKGVLEHLAFAVTDNPGPFTLYIDAIEEVCSFMADYDQDADADLTDFSHFQACFNGPNRPPMLADCADADADSDSDVDLADFGVFQTCFNGPNRPLTPACPGRSDP